jgi:MtrB/PioB family decaheme-associated outer membrane protein
VDTKRQKIDGGLSFILSPTLSVNVAARHEEKDGTKLTGAAFGGFKGALLPEPISSTTDNLEAGFRYADGKARLSIGYSGSFYRNDIKGWFADTPFTNSTVAGAGVLNNRIEMNGAPSNQMHQLTLSGGYAFSPTTKLAVSGSESRMTQNQSFAYQSGPGWNVPVSSPDAKEIQTKFLAKLTMRPVTDLFLSAAYKYDYRDSKTPVNTFLIAQYDGIALPGSTAINNNINNVPINRKQQQFIVDGDYSLGRGQVIAAGYQWEQIDRTADAAVNPVSHEVQTPWLSEKTTEHTVKIDYRNTMVENVSVQVGYARSERRASNYEEPELIPSTGSANIGLYQELPGFRQFYLADRNRDKVRGALNFQASDALSLQASVDYLNDKYPSQYGVQESTGWALNFDATHAVSDNLSFNLFVTYEDMKARQNSLSIAVERTTTLGVVAQPHTSCTPYPNNPSTYIPADYYTDPCRQWSETQADKVTTVGTGFKWNGLMGGRLALSGNVVYSRAVTPISFTGGTYFSNGLAGTAGLNTFIVAQNMPDSISEMYDLRLGARYTLSKSSALRFDYLYRHLKSNDALYDSFINSALGVLATQAYIGPGMTSPNYNVQVVAVSYIYSFR